MADTTGSRASKACSYCHSKKIRCTTIEAHASCRACIGAGIECRARTRKKRRTTAQTNAGPRHPSTMQHLVADVQSDGSTTNDNSCQTPEIPASQYHGPASPMQVPESSESRTQTFMGRSHYIRDEEEINESSARSFPSTRLNGLSHLDMSTIASYNGFQIPPAAVREEYKAAYLKYCSPWMPIMSINDLNDISHALSSPLLAQALYVAARRVMPAGRPDLPSVGELYQRAKVLFWIGHENSPINAIKACLLMQWYNPEGPEHVSLDTSEFWLRTAVGLAYQVGLHKEPRPDDLYTVKRRIWWSLVARDSLIAAAHGRPRAINLDDCEVRLPTVTDFPATDGNGILFVRYVEICRMLGDLTECCCRDFLPSSRRYGLESSLLRWLQDIPADLRISEHPQAGNFNARQLHMPYLMSIMIFARFTSREISHTAVLAASFCAGICDGFLSRDEVKFLAPVFTIYCIGSGFTLLTLFPYPELWSAAQTDLDIILNCLSELSKQWRSAIGGFKAVQSAIQAKEKTGRLRPALRLDTRPPSEGEAFFECFPLRLCRLRTAYDTYVAEGPMTTDAYAYAEPGEETHFTHSGDTVLFQQGEPANIRQTLSWANTATPDAFPYGHFGNWLLNEPSIAALGGA